MSRLRSNIKKPRSVPGTKYKYRLRLQLTLKAHHLWRNSIPNMGNTEKTLANNPSKLFGGIGMIVGLLALAVAVGSTYLVEYLDPPPKPIEDTVADLALKISNKVKDSIIKGRVERTAVQKAPMPASKYIPIIALGLGVGGIGFGIIALLRSEDRFIAGTSVALGASAIIAQYAILLTLALVVAILVAAVLSQLGVS